MMQKFKDWESAKTALFKTPLQARFVLDEKEDFQTRNALIYDGNVAKAKGFDEFIFLYTPAPSFFRAIVLASTTDAYKVQFLYPPEPFDSSFEHNEFSPPAPEGLTENEVALYNDLVQRGQHNALMKLEARIKLGRRGDFRW